MSSTVLGLSKREGRSLSQDKRRGRSRSPSAYLRKKGRRLSDLLSGTSLKTLVPKRADEFLGSNSSSSPKRTASISSFTSFMSPDVPEATLTKASPSKEESHECPNLLVDIPQDTSMEEDQPTEGSTEDESDVSQPSDATPVDDETPVVPIAIAEKHSDDLTLVSGSLNVTHVTFEAESIPCVTQVNGVVEDLLPNTHEEKISEKTRMKSISTIIEDSTRNTPSDKELMTESTAHVIVESQASNENEVLPEVAEGVSTVLSNISAQEISQIKTLESIVFPNALMKTTEENDVRADYNKQTPIYESKGFLRLVVKIVLLLAVLSVTIFLWMALKNHVRRNELSKSQIDHNVLSQLMDINPKAAQVSLSKWHKLIFNAKRLGHDVQKTIGKSFDLKTLADTKKSVFLLEDSVDLEQKLGIRSWIARAPHIIDSLKVGVIRK